MTVDSIRKFSQYVVVGALGFLVDAAGFAAALSLLKADPFVARFVSASIAIAVTFVVNRAWTFSGRHRASVMRSAFYYLLAQGAGFLCNIGAFSAVRYVVPSISASSAFLLSAVVGLAANYLGASKFAFRAREATSRLH